MHKVLNRKEEIMINLNKLIQESNLKIQDEQENLGIYQVIMLMPEKMSKIVQKYGAILWDKTILVRAPMSILIDAGLEEGMMQSPGGLKMKVARGYQQTCRLCTKEMILRTANEVSLCEDCEFSLQEAFSI